MIVQLFTTNSQLRRLINNSEPSLSHLLDLQGRVQEAYRDLAAPLPADHAWKTQAATNSARMRDLVLNNQEEFGLTGREATFISLLAYTHGLGRLAEATPKYKDANPKATHGLLAAEVFTRTIVDHNGPLAPLWSVSYYAIRHRTDASMPPHGMFGDAEYFDAAHELLGILRDIVMYDGLVPERIRPKLESQKEKDKLLLANWSEERRAKDPLLGLERHEILPKSQLERFVKRESLVRSEYESYETLMLETLSYVFKFETPAMAKFTISAGGPSLVFRYLQRQLDESEFQAIKNALFRWNDRLAIQIMEGPH